MAREPVPRRRVRRAVAPVLLFVRRQGRLVAALRGLERDPALHPRGHRPLSGAAVRAFPRAGQGPAVRCVVGPVARADRRWRTSRTARRPGDRAFARASHPGHPGPRPVPRTRVPLRALGPRVRSCGPTGRLDRHRRQRHPVLPAHRATGGSPARVPAHASLGDPARRASLWHGRPSPLRALRRVAPAAPGAPVLEQRIAPVADPPPGAGAPRAAPGHVEPPACGR